MRFVVPLLALALLPACVSKKRIDQAEFDVLRHPNQVEYWVVLGDTYRRAGMDDESASAYQRALALDPGNAEIQRRTGHTRSTEIHEMERRVLADPDNDELWGDLGDLYAQAGDRVTAGSHYRYALSLDPDDSEWIRKVMEFSDGADLDEMISTAMQSSDDEGIGDLADTLMSNGRTEEACTLYMRALSLDPDDGEWMEKASQCPGGMDVNERVIDAAMASGDDERIGDTADMLMQRGDTDEACRLYVAALGIDPDDSEWIRKVGDCPGGDELLGAGADDAIRSGDDERIGDWGDVYMSRGESDFACDLYRQALSIDPDDSEWLEKVGQCDGGIMPTPPSPFEDFGMSGGDLGGFGGGNNLTGLGRAALANGDRQAALQHFEAALLEAPTDRDARTAVMALTGKSLVAMLEELTPQRPEDDELWGDLADAYLESGNSGEALRAYRRAAEIDPDDSEWQRKLDFLDPSRMGGR